MRAPCISTEPERWGARYMASASSFGGPMGTMLWGFSAETLLSLCSPLSSALAETLAVPLSVPGPVRQKTRERHQHPLGPLFSASCQEGGHRWLCPREGVLRCAPFSGQTQGDVPCVWPPSPEPAAQNFRHKSMAPSPQASSHISAGRFHLHIFACAVPPA